MSDTVTASDGKQLPIDSLTQVLTYTTIGGNPYIQTITVTYGAVMYKKTFTYTSTNLTGVSQWIPQ